MVVRYWEKEQFKQFKDILAVITPDVAQLIKLLSASELEVVLEPLSLHTKELIVLAINDNDSRDSAGGSHWSILAYFRKDSCFRHYDSMLNTNLLPASTCARKLAAYLFGKLEQPAIGGGQVMKETVPQQSNGYDCGVYAACFGEYLIKKTFGMESRPLDEVVTYEMVQSWRKKCKELVESLKELK
jgi:sentrin-specific protease 8